MSQNRYDDADFFAAYSQLPRSVDGLHAAPEWPMVRALLPPLGDARVLDLGCGFGWFCSWAAAEGAAAVHGIDLSEKMLERARTEHTASQVTYERADLEAVHLAPDAYDVVYSSLVLHYVVDLDRLLAQVAAALVPGGAMVLTMEHPIFTAPIVPAWLEHEGRPVWALDGYSRPGHRVRDWLAPGVVKQHRSISDLWSAFRRAGLTITTIAEWVPTTDDLEQHPDWVGDLDRPMFLILAAERRA